MTKTQELETRMNVTTFDGHLARVDVNSAGEWYTHRDVRCAQRKEYLTRKGTWESSSTDRWPTLEAALGFARFGPVNVETEPAHFNLQHLEDERTEAQADKADLFDFYHANWDKLIAEIRRLRKGTW
jgi:hypothetical protein